MLEKLIPVSTENSLRQVVASVYAQSPLIQPTRFKKFLEPLNYQKFEPLKSRKISIRVNGNNNEIKDNSSEDSDVGFRLTSYNLGRINKLIQVEEGENNKETTKFSYYSMKYPKWETFKESLLKDFGTISQEDNPFIKAISLTYVNEFLWDSSDDIVIEEIFNKNADFMSAKFFISQNSSFSISTEDYKEDYKSIERLDIVVSKQRKTIQTNSQLIFELIKPIKFNNSISDGILGENLENIHTEIKNTLRKLFTEDVKQKIGLL